MVQLGELAAPTRGAFAMGPFGSSIKAENFVSFGVPVIRGGNLNGTRLLEEGFVYLTEEKADSLKNAEARPGDIVITHRGTLGQVVMVPRISKHERYIVSQSQLKLTLDESKALPEFVTYWLQSSAGQHALLSFAAQTGVPALAQPLSNVRLLDVPLPSLGAQRQIVSALGAIDDKIESNRRLEQVASALIDTQAKRLLETAAAETLLLSSVVEFNRAQVKPGSTRAIDYIDIASVSPGRVDTVSRLSWDKAPSRARRAVADGDVIFSTVRPGRRSFALLIEPSELAVASTGFAVMTPLPRIGSSLLTTVAASPEFAQYLESVAQGSAYPAVSVEAMGRFKLSIPVEQRAVDSFEADTMPLRRRVAQAESENLRLEALRSTLLSELLSGRLRLPVQEAV